MALKLITPPTAEPVSLQEAKLHLRLIADPADTSVHPDDDLIRSLIVAARQGAEHLTGRALMPQTWELALDSFEDEIRPPNPPLVSVTSVKYTDTAGAEQTLDPSAYKVDDYSEPARLVPAYGTTWPAMRSEPNAVRVRYTAGYQDAAAVPAQVRSWILLRVGTLYEHREDVAAGITVGETPFVGGLLDPYRIWGA